MKQPNDKVRVSVYLSWGPFAKLKQKLVLERKAFSRWVSEKIQEEVEKDEG